MFQDPCVYYLFFPIPEVETIEKNHVITLIYPNYCHVEGKK